MPVKTKPAIAYIRVSTQKQGEAGAGLDLQMIRIEAYAKEAGFTIIRTFRDEQSGAGDLKLLERKGAREAVLLSRSEGVPIIVDSFSRLSRNVATLEELVANGGLKVISAANGERAGRAVIMAEAERAQGEVERIRSTTREGLKRARDRGVKLGNPTNLDEAQRKGAARNAQKARERAEQLVPVITTLRSQGITSRPAIAKALNERGLRTARGQRWTDITLRRVLDLVDKVIEERSRKEEHDRNKDKPLWGMF